MPMQSFEDRSAGDGDLKAVQSHSESAFPDLPFKGDDDREIARRSSAIQRHMNSGHHHRNGDSSDPEADLREDDGDRRAKRDEEEQLKPRVVMKAQPKSKQQQQQQKLAPPKQQIEDDNEDNNNDDDDDEDEDDDDRNPNQKNFNPSGTGRSVSANTTTTNTNAETSPTALLQSRSQPEFDSQKGSAPRAAGKSSVKKFFCYVNRDMKTPRQLITIDLKHMPALDKFLDKVQHQVQPEFGVVRSLVHLKSGIAISSAIEVIDGDEYVACGNKRYKAMPYTEILDLRSKEQQLAQQRAAMEAEFRRKNSTMSSGAKAQYLEGVNAVQPKMILVVYNGDRTGDNLKVKLAPRDLMSFEKVLEVITDKMQVHLMHGDVKKLYTLEGKEVSSVAEVKDMRDGGVYVAVDRPPFKSPYLKWTPDGTLVKVKPKLPPVRRGSKLDVDPNTIGWDFLTDNIDLVQDVLMQEFLVEVVENVISDQMNAAARLHAAAREKIETMNAVNSYTRLYDELILDILDCVMRPQDESPAEFEEQIRVKFKDAIEAAYKGKLAHWETDPVAFVALVVLLDQFPRSIYRGKPKMYSYDDKARDCVLRCIQTGIMDQIDPPIYRLFPCFALAHQEDVEMIRLCLREWDKVADRFSNSDPIWDTVKGFKHNLEIIEAFGRFPGRNEILERPDTDEEKEFLLRGGVFTPSQPEKRGSKLFGGKK